MGLINGGLRSGGLRNLSELDAIPDSAIYYWDPSSFKTGDSVWTDEEAAVDMSMTGDLQKTNYSSGEDAVESDGIDDHGLATQADIGANLNNFALETPIETTQSSDGFAIGVLDSNSRAVYLIVNQDGNFNSDSGEVGALVTDDTTSTLTIDTNGNETINDGNRHDVTVNVIDASNNDIELIVDGTTYSSAVQTGSPSNFANLTNDVGYFARNSKGTIDNRVACKLGPIIWHDQDISSQTL